MWAVPPKSNLSLFIEEARRLLLGEPTILNPTTGLPAQTADQFADKQIYRKTRNRIRKVASLATGTRLTPNGSQAIPAIDDIMDVRTFVFRLEGNTPELRDAVMRSLSKLKSEFPDCHFGVRFRGNYCLSVASSQTQSTMMRKYILDL